MNAESNSSQKISGISAEADVADLVQGGEQICGGAELGEVKFADLNAARKQGVGDFDHAKGFTGTGGAEDCNRKGRFCWS